MRKRMISILLTLCMVLSIAPAAVFAEDSTAPADITGEGTTEGEVDITGAGTETEPYLIYTAAGLKTFRDKVNGQNGLTKQPGAHAMLMADIVLNNGTFDEDGNWSDEGTLEEWTPIGWFKTDSDNAAYTGTFDGNGKTITGLYVKDVEYAGLFGYAANATIKNLAVDGYISTTVDINRAGGIVGRLSDGTVTGCFNSCTINTTGIAGGIVGILNQNGNISDCGNAGTISGNWYKGGIVGSAFGENYNIQNCYNIGAIIGDSNYHNGIAGSLGYFGWIRNCYWLTGTANLATRNLDGSVDSDTVDKKSKAEFADGTVLGLLKNGDENSPWTTCGYLEAAGMIVPLLSWQTSDTFPIRSKADLEAFRDAVNGGNSGLCAKLMEDIDLNEEQWTPIGSKDTPYSGTFDGNGHTIKGLYVDERGKNTSAGLFGYIKIADSGTPVVQNLTVDGTVFAGDKVADYPSDYYGAGILVGEIRVIGGGGDKYATIKNCHVSGTVSSPTNAGGLAGYVKNTYFENCTADVEVKGHAHSGGFVGYADQSEFTDCVARGNVTSTGWMTGGFAGWLFYNTTVTHCAAYGNVEAYDLRIGGFVGYAENSVTIKNSIAMGDVACTADEWDPMIGGFAGDVSASLGAVTFEKCHANGKVKTAEGRVGYGMIGQVSNNFKTTDCSFNSEKNPSLKATNEDEREGIEGKDTAGVLNDVCVNYCRGEHTDTDKDHKCDVCETVLSECADNDNDGKCDVCGKVLRSSSTGGSSSRPGYTVTVEKSTNGSVSADRKTASRGTTVTITVTPDKGYTLETITVLDKNGNELKLTDKGDGKYSFIMPSGKVTVTATFMDDNTMLNFFVDVKASDYYYDAVLWAAQNGITSGTDAVHFSPSLPCTRAQIVTFLWRAAGSPVVNYAMNMTDVSEDAYYAEAVRWALSLGITTGTTATTFSPDETCTRAQAVAFLFRYAAPAAVTLQELVSGFSDAASVPGYALASMNWALAEGIVQGDGTKLMPNDACTRAQIVTLLYRTLEQ